MRKNVYVFILVSILSITMFNIGTGVVSADGANAIYIEKNADFSIYASSGNGSIINPYIIEDISIESFGGSAVYVKNTTDYCIFRNIDISGTSPGYGFYLRGVSNVNITDSVIVDQTQGLQVYNSTNIGIINVSVTYDDSNTALGTYGVRLKYSNRILIENCSFDSMDAGVQLWSSYRVFIRNNIFIKTGLILQNTAFTGTDISVVGNTVNGKLLGYLYNAYNKRINISAYGQVILVSCTNVTLYGGVLDDVGMGAQFIFCHSCTIALSNISNSRFGIMIYESFRTRIYSNNIINNTYGATGFYALGTIIHENNFINNTVGLWPFVGCSSSDIYLNNFIGNDDNIWDDGSRSDSQLNWVSAQFRNSVSGWPVANATITIERAGITYIGHTNEDGIIRLPVPLLGEYSVIIEKLRYTTIVRNVDIIENGIHIFNVQMYKKDLGAGTGYILTRTMDAMYQTPIEGAEITVYSYLDGAFYYHSQHTTATGGSFPGWANITGLYYDNYVFIITHPSYVDEIIVKTIISNGLAGTYSNIEMDPDSIETFVQGYVYDFTNELPLEGVNVTFHREYGSAITVFTNSDGLYNMTGLPFGIYQAEYSLGDYNSQYETYQIDHVGSYYNNPANIRLFPSNYTPLAAEESVVNNYDNEVVGNYWDDFNPDGVLAADGGYSIPGTNPDDPEDEYPLDEPFVPNDQIPTTTTTIITTTSTTTITTITEFTEFDWTFIVVGIVGVSMVCVIALFIRKRK